MGHGIVGVDTPAIEHNMPGIQVTGAVKPVVWHMKPVVHKVGIVMPLDAQK
jgi:hypothetical protein